MTADPAAARTVAEAEFLTWSRVRAEAVAAARAEHRTVEEIEAELWQVVHDEQSPAVPARGRAGNRTVAGGWPEVRAQHLRSVRLVEEVRARAGQIAGRTGRTAGDVQGELWAHLDHDRDLARRRDRRAKS